MKRLVVLLTWMLFAASSGACSLVPILFGASLKDLESRLDLRPAGGFAVDKEDVYAPEAASNRDLPHFMLTLPGRQVCALETLLDNAWVTYSFAFDHLYRVEVRHTGRQQLMRLSARSWGPPLRSKRVSVDPARPVHRWNLTSAFVTYSGLKSKDGWQETVEVLGKGQQVHVQRLHSAQTQGGLR